VLVTYLLTYLLCSYTIDHDEDNMSNPYR